MKSLGGALVLLAACAAAPHDPALPLVGPVTGFAELDGARYACSQAGVARIDTGPAVTVCDPAFRVVALTGDPADGSLCAVGGTPGEAGVVARVRNGAVVARATVAGDLVSCVAIDPVDRTVMVGCDDGRVLALEPDTLAIRAELRRHTAPVRALALSGDLLASAGRDGNLMLGPRDATPRVLRDHTAGIECATWSADGARLASGSRDGRIRVHDHGGRLLWSSAPLRAQVLCVTALPNGGFAFGTDRGAVLAIGADVAIEPVELAELGSPVHALAVSSSGLLAGVGDGVRVVEHVTSRP